jgi:hypothetical protein
VNNVVRIAPASAWSLETAWAVASKLGRVSVEHEMWSGKHRAVINCRTPGGSFLAAEGKVDNPVVALLAAMAEAETHGGRP